MTTGGKPRLLGISKRGNVYLRKLLIHGARAALPSLSGGATPLGRWLRGLLARAHRNVVVVALANKLARIAWAVLRSGGSFEAKAAAGVATRSADRVGPARCGRRCLRVVGARWPDSRPASRKPGSKNGATTPRFYEDRGARISILAGAMPRGRIR